MCKKNFFILLIFSLVGLQAQASPSAALGYQPKYPPGFNHFDYVNPQAPKKGELVLSASGSFDRLNPFLLKGVAAAGIEALVFEPLMEQSQDEPYSLYAHLAEDIQLAEDKLSVVFRLNPAARFSDDTPVTAEDVKFSFDTLKSKQAHPFYRFYWADIDKATVIDERTIRFHFTKINPELHLVIAQMRVFPKHWVGDKAFDSIVTKLPIGSGPYRVLRYDIGKSLMFERNPRYWAKDLNTRRGMFNFEKINFKYYRDETVELEAFKAGEFDFIYVLNSKKWARDYVGPQFIDGRIKKEEVKHRNNAGMQAFIFNLRRPLFQDKRVREAIALSFDFEWSNSHLFYNQYKRCYSYFSNSELAASGLPKDAELELLAKFRDRLPPEVFTSEWAPPTTMQPSSLRENLKKAKALLEQAGWRIKDNVLTNTKGQLFEFEIPLAQAGFERILAPWAKNLAKLGIVLKYRTIDAAIYQRRVDRFDFDMLVQSFNQSQSPGNELINMWHSSTANQEGSNNLIGLADPVIDDLIEKVIYAPNRAQLVTAVHALDRVLLHGEYLVPNWFTPIHRISYWQKFAYPQTLPLYYSAEDWMIRTWWFK